MMKKMSVDQNERGGTEVLTNSNAPKEGGVGAARAADEAAEGDSILLFFFRKVRPILNSIF